MLSVTKSKVELNGKPRELCIDLASLISAMYGQLSTVYGEEEAKIRMQNAVDVGFAYEERENK